MTCLFSSKRLVLSVVGRFGIWLWLVPVFLLAFYIHFPSLYLGFAGDDFEWWQHGRMALDDPSLLLADLGTFYRPANTWTLALNHLLFSTEPSGYHATNLLLYFMCGLLLWLLLSRFFLPAPARAAVVTLWLCSPIPWSRFNRLLFVSRSFFFFPGWLWQLSGQIPENPGIRADWQAPLPLLVL